MQKILKVISSINLALFILSVSFFITISIRSTYKITVPKIEQGYYTLSNKTIYDNYNILMDYLTKKEITTLKFKELPMSVEGSIHFMDVKNIFLLFLNFLPISSLILLLSLIYFNHYKNFSFLKLGTIFTLVIPISIGIPMIIDFEKTFTTFHELIFSNDYWLFDPNLDPIINYLPESLFFLNGIMIILFIILLDLLFWRIHKRFRQYNCKSKITL